MKKSTLKWICALLALAVMLVAAYIAYDSLKDDYLPDELYSSDEQAESLQGNTSNSGYEPAPDFTVTDESGKEVSLSDMKGKPVVINIWASWCPPCKAEMPDFQKLYEKYGDEVSFMIINATDGQRETVDSAKTYITENGYTFPVYFDTQFQASIAYGASSIPLSVFINSKGELVTGAAGALSYEMMEKGISMIIEN